MIIHIDALKSAFAENDVSFSDFTGALHIGAHRCEEIWFYEQMGISRFEIIWLEGNHDLVEEIIQDDFYDISHVYHAFISDKDNEEITLPVGKISTMSNIHGFDSSFVPCEGHLSCKATMFVDSYGNRINFSDPSNVDISMTEVIDTSYVSPYHVTHEHTYQTITIDTFFANKQLDVSKYNMWYLSIVSSDLLALKGATKCLQSAKAVFVKLYYNDETIEQWGYDIKDMDEFMKNAGFKRVVINKWYGNHPDALYLRLP